MTSQIQPCTREQILNGMGITTLFSALIVGLWIWLGSSFPVPFRWDPLALAWGAGLGLGVALLSGGVYRLWPAYRRAATAYLHWVADPLQWGDILWVGLLPGWSEEWLFRGVLLSAAGGQPLRVDRRDPAERPLVWRLALAGMARLALCRLGRWGRHPHGDWLVAVGKPVGHHCRPHPCQLDWGLHLEMLFLSSGALKALSPCGKEVEGGR
jgi:hypothetical protein